MYEFIYLMKAVASCLVMNSHFDGIWPISALATGGSIGNCLFFVATGFLLANIKQPFATWYGKKLMRLYPAIILITAISIPFRIIFQQGIVLWGQHGIVAEFLIAANYWFLQALIFMYIPYYFIMSTNAKKYLPQIGLVVCSIYFVCYFAFKDIHVWTIEDGTRFKWIFYFGIMLIGGRYSLKIKCGEKVHSIVRSGCIAALTFVMFYGYKFLLFKFEVLMPFQFIEHVILIIFIYELFAFCLGVEPLLKSCATKWWWNPVKFISSITLEVFLVMDYTIDIFEQLAFPISLVATVAVVWGSAWLLHVIQKPISTKLSTTIGVRF